MFAQKMVRYALAVGTIWFCELAFCQQPQQLGPEDIKIRKVVLYKHGVGYFERSGAVDGNATVTLHFKEPQMRDLLKSFYVLDLDGGTIATVAYDSQDPLERQLREILFNLPSGNALTGFLTQLQGVRVEMEIAGEKLPGRILGLEPVTRKVEDATITEHKLVFQREDGSIQNVTLMDIRGLRVLDEAIQKDMGRYLDLVQSARRMDRKRLVLEARGQGERQVRAGYIIESPIWKTSYRMILDQPGQPLVQGWAIVDNATEEDWQEVELTLVGGSPISFVLDLYTPFYPRRPVVGIQQFAAQSAAPAPSAAPGEERREGIAFAGRKARARGIGAFEEADEYGGAAFAAPEAPPEAERKIEDYLASSMQTAAKGAQVGELFQYAVQAPVTIKRGSSGMVPILLERVEGQKVLYYNPAVQPKHPMNAVLMKNTTELSLESGPITFFEGATCAGEGMLSRLIKPGDDEMLSYSVEVPCTIDSTSGGRQETVHRYTLARGVLTLFQYRIHERLYKIYNKARATTLYLDHPKTPGFQLHEPKTPAVDLPEVARYKLELAEGETREFKVEERREEQAHVNLLASNLEQIAFYLAQSYLRPETRRFLEEVRAIAAKLQERRREQERLTKEQGEIVQDQERLRQNMHALRDNPEENKVRQQYLGKLQKGDERLENLRSRIVQLQEETRSSERELREKLEAHSEG